MYQRCARSCLWATAIRKGVKRCVLSSSQELRRSRVTSSKRLVVGELVKDGTRERIIKAAYAHFYEFGYNGTSVQDIVDRVGVQKGTFYNYFKSKERLGLEALKHYACAGDKVFVPPDMDAASTASGKDPTWGVERIRNQFTQATHFQEGPHGSHGCLMGNFAAESDALPDSFRKLINESFSRWHGAIAAHLERAQEEGEISQSHDPQQLARYLMASWQGTLLLMKISKSRTPIDDFFHFTLDVLLKVNTRKTEGVKRKLQQRRSGV
jgi:TetR/AcrR family transcriptional regulator, transcriptional repressor for nem operon